MSLFDPIRRVSPAAVLLLAASCLPAPAMQRPGAGGHRGGAPSAPHMAAPPAHAPVPGNHPGKNQEHLLQWMQHRNNLTADQQQKALEREPGFRDLPSETQQRMRERLSQLNNMPPEQRQRLLERNEAMARLTVPQRQQVRDTMKQFGSLPTDQKKEVARAFHDLRQTPESQRQSLLNSDRYRQLSDQQRNALSGLLSIEPYHVIMPNGGAAQEGVSNPH